MSKKSAVYSWRLPVELKAELEAIARAERCSVSTLLERLAREGIAARQPSVDEAEQRRITWEMNKYIGTVVNDGVTATNAVVRRVIVAKMEARRARNSPPR